MQTDNSNSALDLPIIPLAILNNIITQFPDFFTGTFPVRDSNTPRHCSRTSRRGQGRIPTPTNPFFSFRTFLARNRDVLAINNHPNIVRVAGEVWSIMGEEERRPWYDEALIANEGRSRAYPVSAHSPSARNSKRAERKLYSNEEKMATSRRSHLAAAPTRQRMPSLFNFANGNESSPSLAASSSSSSSAASTSVASSAICNSQNAMVIDATNIIPSMRNDGNLLERTSDWVSRLGQQSPFSPLMFSLFTSAFDTLDSTNFPAYQQHPSADVWTVRETNIPTLSASAPSSTTSTKATSTFAFSSSSKEKKRQVIYDDSEDDFDVDNEDDATDEDSDFED